MSYRIGYQLFNAPVWLTLLDRKLVHHAASPPFSGRRRLFCRLLERYGTKI